MVSTRALPLETYQYIHIYITNTQGIQAMLNLKGYAYVATKSELFSAGKQQMMQKL